MKQAALASSKFPSLEVFRERMKDHLWGSSLNRRSLPFLYRNASEGQDTPVSNTGSGRFVILHLGMACQILDVVSILRKTSQVIMQPPPVCPPPPRLGHYVSKWVLVFITPSFFPFPQDSYSYVVIKLSWLTVTTVTKYISSFPHSPSWGTSLLFPHIS